MNTSRPRKRRRTTKITLRGSRGMITDADAVILAKDEMIYNVTFYRDASQNSTDEYKAFTQAISEAIDIIEANGNELSVSFVIRRREATDEETPVNTGVAVGEWEFNFGSGVSEAVLQTRESQWRDNNYFSVASVPTAAAAIEQLKTRYQIPDDMSEEKMLKVMAVYSEMQMNLFLSQPVVIAKDVPYETVIEIETRSMNLPGLEIAVGTKRVYPRSTPCRAGHRLHRADPFHLQVGRAADQRLQVLRYHRPGRHRGLDGGLADPEQRRPAGLPHRGARQRGQNHPRVKLCGAAGRQQREADHLRKLPAAGGARPGRERGNHAGGAGEQAHAQLLAGNQPRCD